MGSFIVKYKKRRTLPFRSYKSLSCKQGISDYTVCDALQLSALRRFQKDLSKCWHEMVLCETVHKLQEFFEASKCYHYEVKFICLCVYWYYLIRLSPWHIAKGLSPSVAARPRPTHRLDHNSRAWMGLFQCAIHIIANYRSCAIQMPKESLFCQLWKFIKFPKLKFPRNSWVGWT